MKIWVAKRKHSFEFLKSDFSKRKAVNKRELELLRAEIMANPELLEVVYPPEQELLREYLGIDNDMMVTSGYIAMKRNEPVKRISRRISKALATIKSVMGL